MNKLIAAIGVTLLGAALVTGGALAALATDPARGDNGGEHHGAQPEVVTTSTYPSEAVSVLDVQSGRGSIVVEAWDRNEVQLVETRAVARTPGLFGVASGGWVSKAEARKLLESVRVDTLPDVSALRVRVSEEPLGNADQVSLKLHFRVPRQTAVRLTSTDGAVAVQGIEGGVELRTENGRLTLDQIKGSVNASTENGRVSLADIHGDVRVVTENGAITCDGIEGVADIRSVNGSIRANDAGKQALVCRSTNGSIEVDLTHHEGCGLDIHSLQGNVDCPLALDVPAERNSHSVRGTLRGGGPVLSLSTDNGRIRVSEG